MEKLNVYFTHSRVKSHNLRIRQDIEEKNLRNINKIIMKRKEKLPALRFDTLITQGKQTVPSAAPVPRIKLKPPPSEKVKKHYSEGMSERMLFLKLTNDANAFHTYKKTGKLEDRKSIIATKL